MLQKFQSEIKLCLPWWLVVFIRIKTNFHIFNLLIYSRWYLVCTHHNTGLMASFIQTIQVFRDQTMQTCRQTIHIIIYRSQIASIFSKYSIMCYYLVHLTVNSFQVPGCIWFVKVFLGKFGNKREKIREEEEEEEKNWKFKLPFSF